MGRLAAMLGRSLLDAPDVGEVAHGDIDFMSRRNDPWPPAVRRSLRAIFRPTLARDFLLGIGGP